MDMNFIDANKKYINGPVNVVRLEGKIKDIKKVIYLFIDVHLDVSEQLECRNIYSKDIYKYLAESFYNLRDIQKTYDFFLEINPTDILGKSLNYRMKYILNVRKFFKKIFSYNIEENKVNVSEIFQNIRLHYFDIRDYIGKNTFILFNTYNKILNFNLYNKLNKTVMNEIIENLTKAKTEIIKIVGIFRTKTPKFFDKEKAIIGENIDEDVTKILRLFNKIKYVYHNKEVKRVLNSQLSKLIEELEKLLEDIEYDIGIFKEYINYIDKQDGNKYLHYPNKYVRSIFDDNIKIYKREYAVLDYGIDSYVNRKMIIDIADRCESLYYIALCTFSRIIDIFFLRRFLDKNYITNAIVYSGANHSSYYILILVSLFDFSITHISYPIVPNLKTLEQEIRRKKINNDAITEIDFLFSKEKMEQCSDLTHFPENFL